MTKPRKLFSRRRRVISPRMAMMLFVLVGGMSVSFGLGRQMGQEEILTAQSMEGAMAGHPYLFGQESVAPDAGPDAGNAPREVSLARVVRAAPQGRNGPQSGMN